MKSSVLLLLVLLAVPYNVLAMGSQKQEPPKESEILDPGEPAYCDPKTFLEKEATLKSNFANPHLFKLGDVTLLGLGVGNSDAKELKNYATSNSTASANNKFCTWYYNEGASEAEKAFTHIYLTNPKDLNTSTGPNEYVAKLKDMFANSKNNFLSCAADHKYLAFGCNGMKHRGPTVFGMMLAYTGCKPERAAKVVNVLWGLNGVQEEVRLAIIREGKTLGDQNPSSREKLAYAFGQR